jgi:glucose dehydrogenase
MTLFWEDVRNMAHPSFNRGQATLINVAALSLISLTVIFGLSSSQEDEASNIESGTSASASSTLGQITTERIVAADAAPGDWLAYGRDYKEQRFSPLTQINKDSIDDLELAWTADMYTTRGLEASPIVVDGIMYMTGSWSVVYAVDATTGEEIWSYDPEVPGDWARKACCDVVNRGVAVYDGAVYVASLDGYLISLNAETGEEIWRINTIIDRTKAYTITGAPRIANGRVFIGNGGGEYGVRGYVTAYDAKTAHKIGASSPCPATQTSRLSIRKWPKPPRLGRAANGGKSAVAARSGIPLFMTPIPIRYFWASAMAARGRAPSALRAVAIICSSPPLWRWTQTPVARNGITKPRPAIHGTTPPCRI